MKITTVLFDLDGTLLPMDQDLFVKYYFGSLTKFLANLGYNPEIIGKALWNAVACVMKNDGKQKNEDTFWNEFKKMLGDKIIEDKVYLDEYYEKHFLVAKDSCGLKKEAKEIISLVKEKGLTPVLATNPLFPQVATYSRIKWAGLDSSDFSLVTTYENSSFCKPNPDYYKEILEKLNLKAKECVMVGNDALEDLAAEKIGIKTFILTDNLINKTEVDLSHIPHGDFTKLKEFIESLN